MDIFRLVLPLGLILVIFFWLVASTGRYG